jgi:hypothetical protein
MSHARLIASRKNLAAHLDSYTTAPSDAARIIAKNEIEGCRISPRDPGVSALIADYLRSSALVERVTETTWECGDGIQVSGGQYGQRVKIDVCTAMFDNPVTPSQILQALTARTQHLREAGALARVWAVYDVSQRRPRIVAESPDEEALVRAQPKRHRQQHAHA